MHGNSFGHLFRLSTFGESHGPAIGGIIDGCPAGIKLDFDFIQKELNRRRPGQSHITTQRKEEDKVEFLSGILNNITTGTPIGFIIKNTDAKSKDYDHLLNTFRPSHADYTYHAKYGIYDHKGGGRSSARETVARVVAGAIAKQILLKYKTTITAFVSQVGDITIPLELHDPAGFKKIKKDFIQIEKNIVRCPNPAIAEQMIKKIEQTRKNGDTIGGVITCVIENTPVGLGSPVFNKLHADLGHAMLGINAAKGFEIGSGFDGVKMNGSAHNDIFTASNKKVSTNTNYSGGTQGGISNGAPIYFNTAFKPVATIMRDQDTINSKGEKAIIKGKGRHDPCVVPRAVPIVEAMAALVLVDHLLISKSSEI